MKYLREKNLTSQCQRSYYALRFRLEVNKIFEFGFFSVNA